MVYRLSFDPLPANAKKQAWILAREWRVLLGRVPRRVGGFCCGTRTCTFLGVGVAHRSGGLRDARRTVFLIPSTHGPGKCKQSSVGSRRAHLIITGLMRLDVPSKKGIWGGQKYVVDLQLRYLSNAKGSYLVDDI